MHNEKARGRGCIHLYIHRINKVYVQHNSGLLGIYTESITMYLQLWSPRKYIPSGFIIVNTTPTEAMMVQLTHSCHGTLESIYYCTLASAQQTGILAASLIHPHIMTQVCIHAYTWRAYACMCLYVWTYVVWCCLATKSLSVYMCVCMNICCLMLFSNQIFEL